MPVMFCTKNGRRGHKWGENGVCFVGARSKQKAHAVGRAVIAKRMRSDAVDTKPTQQMADNARRALEVRAEKPESQRGMTPVGLARARQLINRENLSRETIQRMVSYFQRHEVDKQGSTWSEKGKGWQAWMGWGGDAGYTWARRKLSEFENDD